MSEFAAHLASLEAAVELFKAARSQQTASEKATVGALLLAAGVTAAAIFVMVSAALRSGVRSSYESLRRARKMPRVPPAALSSLEGREVAVEGKLDTERPLLVPSPDHQAGARDLHVETEDLAGDGLDGGPPVPALAHLWVESLVYKTSTVVRAPAAGAGPQRPRGGARA